MAPKKVRPVVQ